MGIVVPEEKEMRMEMEIKFDMRPTFEISVVYIC